MTDVNGKIRAPLRFWRRHRIPLAISFVVTAAALLIYTYTFVGERPTPAFDFVHRLELATLDARFQLRGPQRPDPRIVIVDIDQRSQEKLGRWPFPRSYFAAMLDVLREEGARVIAFDIVFSQPDESAQPLRELREGLDADRGRADQRVLQELARLETKYDHDQKFAQAIERFGNVVLGSFFLFTPAEAAGLDTAARDRNADLMEFFSVPQVRPARRAQAAADFARLVQQYKDSQDGVPRAVQSNIATLSHPLSGRDTGTGFFNIFTDADGVVRQALLLLPYGRYDNFADWDLYASLEVQAVRSYSSKPQEFVVNVGEAGVESMEFCDGVVLRPGAESRMPINFRGPARTYPYVSLVDVVERKFPAGRFRDALVFVGPSATGIGDLVATPFGTLDFPGVEVRATVADNILNQNFLKRDAQQVTADVIAILFFGLPVGIWLAMVRPRWMWLALLLLVPFAAGLLWAVHRGWWLNAVTPALLTLIPNTGLVALYRVLVEEREKRKVRGAFQQYVSPEVIRRLLENPRLVEPRKTDITVMFSDIRGFTTLSEKMDAQHLAIFLNSYLTEMTDIVFRHQGTLDKYIGDALMAFWGAPFETPNHAALACRAALEMSARLTHLQQQWREQGEHVFEIGVGLHTGAASVGNMGSKLRYGYTALGDSVNLASRLEGLTKAYGTRILLSESVVAACGPLANSDFLFRELDLIRVKGKRQPVTVFDLLSFRADGGERLELAAQFAEARAAYKRREWAAAKRAFDSIDGRWHDKAAQLFSQQCAGFMAAEPAADWDGVFTFEHK